MLNSSDKRRRGKRFRDVNSKLQVTRAVLLRNLLDRFKRLENSSNDDVSYEKMTMQETIRVTDTECARDGTSVGDVILDQGDSHTSPIGDEQLQKNKRIPSPPHSQSSPKNLAAKNQSYWKQNYDTFRPYSTRNQMDRSYSSIGGDFPSSYSLQANNYYIHNQTRDTIVLPKDTENRYQIPDFDESSSLMDCDSFYHDDDHPEKDYHEEDLLEHGINHNHTGTITFLDVLTDPYLIYAYIQLWKMRIQDFFRRVDMILLIRCTTIFSMCSSMGTLLTTAHFVSSFAAVLTFCFGYYISMQFRKTLVRQELDQRNEKLQMSILSHKAQHAFLKAKIMEQKANIVRMKSVKHQLDSISQQMNLETSLVTLLVKEIDLRKKEIKYRTDVAILHILVKAMIMSNREGTRQPVVNSITVALITSKLRNLSYLTFFPDRFKRHIEKNGNSFQSILRLYRDHVMMTDSPIIPSREDKLVRSENESIFLFPRFLAGIRR